VTINIIVRNGQCRHWPLPGHVAAMQRLADALVKLVALQPWDRSLYRKKTAPKEEMPKNDLGYFFLAI